VRPKFADIVLTRRRRCFIRDQLAAQLEMKMLGGELLPGQRLPSIRAMARMLGVNPNTVSAAYRKLVSLGHVKRRHGVCVFVNPAYSPDGSPPSALDGQVYTALRSVVAQGNSGALVRAQVDHWLRDAKPDAIVVFDPVREMAQLLAHELQDATGMKASALTPADFEHGRPQGLAQAVVVTLPYQVKSLSRFLPLAAFEVLTVHIPFPIQRAIETLPSDAMLLVVSTSQVVLKFARDLIHGLRGDDILLELHHLDSAARWQALLGVADLVITDALSNQAVTSVGHPRVMEARLVKPHAIERVRDLATLPCNPSLKSQ
jgi:GntR family transcriptional regulator